MSSVLAFLRPLKRCHFEFLFLPLHRNVPCGIPPHPPRLLALPTVLPPILVEGSTLSLPRWLQLSVPRSPKGIGSPGSKTNQDGFQTPALELGDPGNWLNLSEPRFPCLSDENAVGACPAGLQEGTKKAVGRRFIRGSRLTGVGKHGIVLFTENLSLGMLCQTPSSWWAAARSLGCPSGSVMSRPSLRLILSVVALNRLLSIF